MSQGLPSASRRFREWTPAAIILCLLAAAAWSYLTGGVMFAVVVASRDSERSIEVLRGALARTGAWGPVVYVAAVVVEVLVAPIPGTLLYAPGGALFGGWWGGTLSLAGNVIGAALAAWLATRFRGRVRGLLDRQGLESLMARIKRRGAVVVALLRVNPLTSSDLVSYAAGLVGIPVWQVAVGTLVGMAPLCYAQAHAADWLFRWLPGAGVIVLGLGAAYAAFIVWVVARGRRERT